ncbi:MAG: nucleotide sugar dehydrogenase [Hydrotalea sp.]|nr:nucleotide sugar dehydrogenase [Hydrotalea sp.]
MEQKLSQTKIAVIGLGYVGLPLALAFSKKYPVIGFDTDANRVQELLNGIDRTNEANLEELKTAIVADSTSYIGLQFTNQLKDINRCDVFIITVPTPIDQFKAPNLRFLLSASEMVGQVLKKGDVVIYESTVYPGCTEEDCVPVLERASKLKFQRDFYCGYSPERINPGDKVNTLTKIKKVTSGSTPEIAQFVDALYGSIITAGTHLAPSIRVAEASKAIENAQRDINISFVNELALIFDKMNIDTHDVLEAAGSKWNFLKFKPGLVGGHCIGVDPYYLAHKAESLGYHPQVILSGRRVNDYMGSFVASKLIKMMIKSGMLIANAKILILGITFKENCPDIRNSRVVDIYNELIDYGIRPDVYDPHAHADEVKKEYDIELSSSIQGQFDGIILAVAHKEFLELNIASLKKSPSAVVFDTKSVLPRNEVDCRL